jgi:hypothetical protein
MKKNPNLSNIAIFLIKIELKYNYNIKIQK